MKTINTKSALISYKGEDILGLIYPKNVQRITKETKIPNGYTVIGKQQFGDGLRICLIPNEKITATTPKRELKKGEYFISGYQTNFDQLEKIEQAKEKIKECFEKDSSENHYNWTMNCAKNRMGLNNLPKEEIEKIVNKIWKL